MTDDRKVWFKRRSGDLLYTGRDEQLTVAVAGEEIFSGCGGSSGIDRLVDAFC